MTLKQEISQVMTHHCLEKRQESPRRLWAIHIGSTEGSQTFSNEDSEQHDPIYVNLEVSLKLNPGDIKWLYQSGGYQERKAI